MTSNRAPKRVATETFSTKFALAEADSKAMTFRGMASVFDAVVDCDPPTIVQRGAFTKTLAEQGNRVKILWQHDTWEPIGRPLSLRETDQGLELVGRLDKIPLGERAMTQIKSGTLTDLSIGFDAISWTFAKPKALPRDRVTGSQNGSGEPVRLLTEAKLWEVSVVTWGAQRAATIQAAARRANRDLERKLRVLDQAADDLRRERLLGVMEGALQLMGDGR
jgi:hypothetical protein